MKQVNKNTIWLLLDSRSVGGIESHILQLATALCDKHISAEVVFFTDHGAHPLHQLLTQKRIPFRILQGGIKGLLHAIQKQRPALIHTHGYKAGILARLVGCLLNVPIVSTFHAGEPGHGKMRVYNAVDRITASLAQGLIAVSAEIAHRLPQQVKLMDNFVSLSEVSVSIKGEIAFVGRLSEEKGPDIFAEIAAMQPDEMLHVYGDGPMYDQLDGHCKNMMLHGQQSDMKKVWPTIGLLCMTSRYEGLPLAALEAMAYGIPVVAFNVGGLGELIQHNKNGWLLQSGDLTGFNKAITNWLNLQGNERSQMSHAARATIEERYSPKVVLPKILDVYQKALGEKLFVC